MNTIKTKYSRMLKKLDEHANDLAGALEIIVRDIPAQIVEIFNLTGNELKREFMSFKEIGDSLTIKTLKYGDLYRKVKIKEDLIKNNLGSYMPEYCMEPASKDDKEFRELFFRAVKQGIYKFSFNSPFTNPNFYPIQRGSATVELISVLDLRGTIKTILKDAMESNSQITNPSPSAIYLIAYEALHSGILPKTDNGIAILHNMVTFPIYNSKQNKQIGSLRLMNIYKDDETEHNFNVSEKSIVKNIIQPIKKEIAPKIGQILSQHLNMYVKASCLKIDINYNFLVGSSPQMNRVYEQMESFAPSNVNLLIRGEMGTGKTLLARAIHNISPRKNEIFKNISIPSVTETIFQSELFGHEKGAFTGADKRRKGLFEIATNGTIFLDEIGDVSKEVQAKLLKVIDEKSFKRVGGNETLITEARIITATNQNLEEKVESGDFREDLYYRINKLQIYIDPLCDRKEDIPQLMKFLFKRHDLSEKVKLDKRIFDMNYWSYDFPGNTRELENLIEQLMILNLAKGFIDLDDWKNTVSESKNRTWNLRTNKDAYNSHLQELESKSRILSNQIESALRRHSNLYEVAGVLAILNCLNDTDGDLEKTAKRSGFSKPALRKKLERMAMKISEIAKKSNELDNNIICEAFPGFYYKFYTKHTN